MNVVEALEKRYSCRDFLENPVSKDDLERVVAAALHTPSWQNSQPWDVYVAGYETSKRIIAAVNGTPDERGRAGLEIGVPGRWSADIQPRIRKCMYDIQRCCENQDMRRFSILNQELFHAPAMIFVAMDQNLGVWSVLDIGAFCQSVMLAAQEYGLQSIPAVAYVNHPDVVRRELDIPEDKLIVFGIGIGYENKDNPINRVKTERKGLDEVVFKD